MHRPKSFRANVVQKLRANVENHRASVVVVVVVLVVAGVGGMAEPLNIDGVIRMNRIRSLFWKSFYNHAIGKPIIIGKGTAKAAAQELNRGV